MTVCIHGLGYIGLPTAAMLAQSGHDVVGYDTNPAVLEQIRCGDVDPEEPGLHTLVAEALESGTLRVTDVVPPAEYHLICVPTPLNHEDKRADLTYVERCGATISRLLRPGDTVVLESTVPPGTTRDVLGPILETSGLRAGVDFGLAHCPETVLPGNIISELKANDRIVGGIDERSTDATVRLYASFVEGRIRVAPDVTTAEFVKLVQNTFRDTNIALANEIAKLAADYGIDSRDAIDLANGHPRVSIHQPGPGVGGHCLPIDPWFLGQHSDALELIAHAREINEGMADYVVDLLWEELSGVECPKVAVLGVAYKGNVSDARESPGLAIARVLQETAVAADGGETILQSVEVALHDDHVDDQRLTLCSLDDALDGADAIIVVTDHDEFTDLCPSRAAALMRGTLVVDTKGVLDPEQWRTAGYTIRRL